MTARETDRVAAALAHLYEATTASLVTPEVGLIARRARRRRARQAVLAGAAVLLAVGLGAVVGGPLRAGETMPPVAPTSPEPTMTAAPERIDPAEERIYSGFLESPTLAAVDDDWSESRDTGLPVDCVGVPVDQVAVERSVASGSVVRIMLLLYADESTARSALTTLTPELRACLGYPDAPLALPGQWPSYGDASVAMTFLKPADGAGELTGWPLHAVAVRVGRAVEVFLTYPTHSADGPVSSAAPGVLQAVIEQQVPRLCLYSESGCRPSPPLPSALPALTRNGEAWALVLAADPVASGSETPLEFRTGRAVAALADLGYHPSVVEPGCDVGVAESEPYVALYFAQQSEAQALVSQLALRSDDLFSPLPVPVRVTTRCVR